MAKSVPAHEFTVGWVCALPVELAAAVEMMDEEFADLPSHPTDSNIYSFGRFGAHNVVAACLPAGQIGTNPAAAVASQMQQSFPSLRFDLLVGIGGGVPHYNNDIRLGDVVISQPAGQHGGVVQYDYGKTGPDGYIIRTGSLNTPPTLLLNALAKLRANDFRSKTQVSAHLSKLSSKFASPGPNRDTLYNLTGAACDRQARETTDPILFFGTIASGNQVMRDGPTRDQHSQELGGVLCFEMEAAGLMNSFPCLVVRGISDYADEYMTDFQWQPYAASTAAAFTKELLCAIPPLASSELATIKEAMKVSERLPLFRKESKMSHNIVFTGFYIMWLLTFSTWLGVATFGKYSDGWFGQSQQLIPSLILGITSGLVISMVWCLIFKTLKPFLAAILSTFLFSFVFIWILSTVNVPFWGWVVFWCSFWLERTCRVLESVLRRIDELTTKKEVEDNDLEPGSPRQLNMTTRDRKTWFWRIQRMQGSIYWWLYSRRETRSGGGL